MKEVMVIVVETIQSLHGKTNELKQALRELVPICRKEHGCLQYDLLEPPTPSGDFLILMRWKTSQDLDNHENSPAVLAFAEKYNGVLYKEFDVSVWKHIL